MMSEFLEINPKSKLNTIYGTAVINKDYFRLASKENRGKYLHKIIFENFYKHKVPKNCIIHHKDGNPRNNCIMNLQLLTRSNHSKYHNSGEKNGMYGRTGNKHHNYGKKASQDTINKSSESHLKFYKENPDKIIRGKNHPHYGKKFSLDTRIKKSKKYNSTGILNVSKVKTKNCKCGYNYRYKYYEDGKTKVISSIDLDKLKEKVKSKNLQWVELY